MAIRPTARVVLLDQRDCALLFCAAAVDGHRFWFTPGGDGEPGELAEAAARRELDEETGLTAVELDCEIWRRTVRVPFEGESREFCERWFLLRVERFEPNTSGFDQLERDTIGEHHWWTVDELCTTADRLVPYDLDDRLAALLRDGPPWLPLDISPTSDR